METSQITDLKRILANSLEGIEDPIERSRNDFCFYLENVVHDEGPHALTDYIQLADFHREIADTLMDDKTSFLLVEAFRGSGKSSLASVAWPAYLASLNPSLRFALISKTDDQAITQLTGIEAILRSAEHQRIFGDLVPHRQYYNFRAPWSEQEKVIVRPKFSRFPTFLAAGVESSLVVGKRFDCLVADDVIDLTSSFSPTTRNRIKHWFYQVLLPTRDQRWSKVVVIGTPWVADDLYDSIAKEMAGKSFFKHIRIPAIQTEQTDHGPIYKSAWPEVFPLTNLNRIKSEGHFAFQNQYMLERYDVTQSILKKEWLKLIQQDYIPKELTILQGIDPNAGRVTGKTGDMLALATVGIDADRQAYLLDLVYIKGDIQEQLLHITDHITRWNPKDIASEIEATQAHFKNYLEAKLKETLGLDITIRGITSKNVPKPIRLRAMFDAFIAGKVLVAAHVNWETGDLEPLPSLLPFVEEWISYSANAPHDDALDAVDIALSSVLEYGGRLAALTIPSEAIIIKDRENLEKEEEMSEEDLELADLLEKYEKNMTGTSVLANPSRFFQRRINFRGLNL